MRVAAVMVILALISVIAVAFAVRSKTAEAEAQRRGQQATASRLESEALAMLSQDRPGGDVRAMQQLLAANVLAPESATDGLLDGVLQRLTTAKIADAGAGVSRVVWRAPTDAGWPVSTMTTRSSCGMRTPANPTANR